MLTGQFCLTSELDTYITTEYEFILKIVSQFPYADTIKHQLPGLYKTSLIPLLNWDHYLFGRLREW